MTTAAFVAMTVNASRLPREHRGHAARRELRADERCAERPSDDGQDARYALQETLQPAPMEPRGRWRASHCSLRKARVGDLVRDLTAVGVGDAVRLQTGADLCVLGLLLRLRDLHALVELGFRSAGSSSRTRVPRRRRLQSLRAPTSPAPNGEPPYGGSRLTRRVIVRPNRSGRRRRPRDWSRPGRISLGKCPSATSTRVTASAFAARCLHGCAHRRLRPPVRRPPACGSRRRDR